MRGRDPIVSLPGGITIVALNEDVIEVLGDPARFTAHLYGPKMEAVTGPFILGVDDVPLYHHDHAAMDRAVTREDLPVLAERMYETAQGLVAARRDDGEIDVVTQLADPAIDSGIAAYFGTPGPGPRDARALGAQRLPGAVHQRRQPADGPRARARRRRASGARTSTG